MNSCKAVINKVNNTCGFSEQSTLSIPELAECDKAVVELYNNSDLPLYVYTALHKLKGRLDEPSARIIFPNGTKAAALKLRSIIEIAARLEDAFQNGTSRHDKLVSELRFRLGIAHIQDEVYSKQEFKVMQERRDGKAEESRHEWIKKMSKQFINSTCCAMQTSRDIDTIAKMEIKDDGVKASDAYPNVQYNPFINTDSRNEQLKQQITELTLRVKHLENTLINPDDANAVFKAAFAICKQKENERYVDLDYLKFLAEQFNVEVE